MQSFELNPRARWLETRTKAILILDSDSLSYHRLNRVGALVWKALAGGQHTSREISILVKGQCSIDTAILECQIEAFLNTLADRKLVTASQI